MALFSLSLSIRQKSLPIYSRSIKLAQIHATVQAGDFLLVAVEHFGLYLVTNKHAAGYARFGGLRPARVVDFGINVSIKAVFARQRSYSS